MASSTDTSHSESFFLSSKVRVGALQALKEAGGTACRQDVLAWVQNNRDPTPWEEEASGQAGPADYGSEFAPRVTRETAALHALPERWWEMAYEDFLHEHRVLVAGVTRLGLN